MRSGKRVGGGGGAGVWGASPGVVVRGVMQCEDGRSIREMDVGFRVVELVTQPLRAADADVNPWRRSGDERGGAAQRQRGRRAAAAAAGE